MGVQRYTLSTGAVRYRARVKSHGRYVANAFSSGRLMRWPGNRTSGGDFALASGLIRVVARCPCRWWRRTGSARAARSSAGLVRVTRRRGGITSSRVSASGRCPRSRRRKCRAGSARSGPGPGALDRDPCPAMLRSILAFAVADGRVQHNVAAAVRKPTSGRARREGQAVTLDELARVTEACQGRYRDVVPGVALAGPRWGELAGLQVGDRVSVPGPGLRLRRAVLASGGGGAGMWTH